ncbi:MAG: Do family serine endopeptidase [Spirochaetales bacterium]|nr:Do family serine endopeptidase [Spirochaetales bacterium]
MIKLKKFLSSGKINLILIGVIIGLVVGITAGGGGLAGRVQAGKTDLVDMQYTFRAVSADVLPVVVEIRVVEVQTQVMPKGYSWPFNFIDPEEEGPAETQEYETEGLGSGVIVRKDGNKYYVLTNNHVLGSADRITIRLNDKSEIKAEIVGTDERKDLALVSFFSDKPLETARLGNSDDLYVGDWVLAVGSPLGYESTVTAGIVSAIGRNGPRENISDFIQTDASINQGNSGGALVNLDGEVVGINTWIATTTGVSIGLGFSIPVNNIKNAIDDFIEDGSVQYGWLGVTITDPDQITAEDLGLTGMTGAIVNNIYENSPAGLAGLLPGDLIIKVDGQEIKDYKHFTRAVGDIKAGETIELTVIRNKEQIKLSALIVLRKNREELIELYDYIWPGFTAIPLEDKLKSEFGLPESVGGVIISVEPGTRAFKSGLKDYDIITVINGNEINNMMDFYQSINDKNNKYRLNIIRNNSEVIIEMEK